NAPACASASTHRLAAAAEQTASPYLIFIGAPDLPAAAFYGSKPESISYHGFNQTASHERSTRATGRANAPPRAQRRQPKRSALADSGTGVKLRSCPWGGGIGQ